MSEGKPENLLSKKNDEKWKMISLTAGDHNFHPTPKYNQKTVF